MPKEQRDKRDEVRPPVERSMPKRPDPASAGQSGDLQGLPDEPEATNESVRELAEEGNYFEASLIDGVENAPEPDQKKVKTREARNDDVPDEYLEQDKDEPKE